MPSLISNCNFNALFGQKNLGFGETHTERASCKAVMDVGITQPDVKYLFMEALLVEMQEELDQYYASPSQMLPESLRDKLLFQDVAYFASAEDGVSRAAAYQIMGAIPRSPVVNAWIIPNIKNNVKF